MNAEELISRVGEEWEPGVYEIERGMIRRFARAIGDPNPLWQDEEYAGKARYGGVVAPPAFILTIGFERLQDTMAALMPSGTRRLHGGTELECYRPVRPGDIITVNGRIANVRERKGRAFGSMVFVTFDITYTNQKQEMVARCRQLSIAYGAEGAKNG